MTKKEYRIVLISITLCWSSAYLFIKEIPQEFSPYAYLALTSGAAAVILSLVFHKLYLHLNRASFFRGLILGLLITGNILFEKLGLDELPASTVSALATLNIVIVPVILIFRKQYPSRNNIAGIIIIILGLYLSNRLHAEGGGLKGILWILISCFMMSLYTVLAADYTRKSDPLLLTVLQLSVTAVIGLVLWLITDPGSFSTINWSPETVSYILIIAFFSKAYAYVMLMYTEKYADAISVTVIASTEPLVTMGLAILLPRTFGSSELFSLRPLAGALVIAIGAVVSGTDFLSGKKKGKQASSPDAPAPGVLSGEVPSKRRLFFETASILLCFVVLGVSIHVMEFAGGLSSIRPQNALPSAAGILAGPIRAAACALGNLLVDLFWLPVYGSTVVLGVLGNFMAAFLPWIIWRSLSGRIPDAHSWKALLIFIWAAFLGNIACAWILDLGLQIFFPHLFQPLMIGTFWNNFLFSLALGLPLFIVITTGERTKGLRYLLWKTPDPSRQKKECPFLRSLFRRVRPSWLLACDSALFLLLFLAEYMGFYWANSLSVRILNGLTCLCLVLTCFLPRRKEAIPA